jgi:hypothetical protein
MTSKLGSPIEGTPHAKPMATRNLRNNGPRTKRLCDNAAFVIIREPPPAPRSRNHLEPAQRFRLRLKLMVKNRHSTISDLESVTLVYHHCQ